MKIRMETIISLYEKAKENAISPKDKEFLGSIWYAITREEPWLSRRQVNFLKALGIKPTAKTVDIRENGDNT